MFLNWFSIFDTLHYFIYVFNTLFFMFMFSCIFKLYSKLIEWNEFKIVKKYLVIKINIWNSSRDKELVKIP